MTKVRRALVPAAGRGTRMHPFTLAVPKELAPLGSRPALHLVLDEAVAAGIEEAIVVLSPEKDVVRRYLELAQGEGAWPRLRVRFTLQREPTGLADAIAVCAALLGGDPFALLLPDNVALAPEYRLEHLLAAWEPGRHVVGVLEIDSSWNGLYGDSGRIEHRPLRPGLVAIDRLHDKRPGRLRLAPGERALRACGRYALGPEIFARIEQAKAAVGGRPGGAGAAETSEVPAVQILAREGALLGAHLPGPLFDVGHPEGLLAASAFLAAAGSASG